MRHIKVFESYSEIDSICNEFGITNWTVNSDGAVDIDGDVKLGQNRLEKLPLKFGRVSGNFFCSFNKLTTLEGAPNEVGGNFYCHVNNLVTLEGSPSRVGGNFLCGNNKLISLEGIPKDIGGRFSCGINPIFRIYNLFPDHKSYIDSLDYNYLRGKTIVKSRFKEALDEFEIELPRSISGYKYI